MSNSIESEKEKYTTAEIYKKDGRIKNRGRFSKNLVGLRYIKCIDFFDMTNEEIESKVCETWQQEDGYIVKLFKTYTKRKNLLSGQYFYERYDTPGFCSPSSESYWSM